MEPNALDLTPRLEELGLLRRLWMPPTQPAALADRRAHAAWANAGIEGNPLPWPEARRLLADGEPAHGPAREIAGCLAALEFMETIQPPLLLSHLRLLHDLVMAGLGTAAGDLRRREVAIVKESGPDAGRPVFQPPHPARIPELIDALLRSHASGATALDPALAAGRFHYEFQSIHPFQDGNGRVGRILSTWLARRGWPADGFYLAPAIARAGAGYYLALRAVRPDYESDIADGMRPWLLPFLDMFEDALRRPEPPADRGASG
jgi:Fic family protein